VHSFLNILLNLLQFFHCPIFSNLALSPFTLSHLQASNSPLSVCLPQTSTPQFDEPFLGNTPQTLGPLSSFADFSFRMKSSSPCSDAPKQAAAHSPS